MGSFFYNLIIRPIVLILEVIFSISYKLTQNPGISIVFVSIAVSILTSPLYRRADAIQEEEREKKKQMDRWVTHIQKHFRGDEKVMMLNTYYRQQNYKPIYALRSSLSLLLQIPFFIAAYRFLSGLQLLQGAAFLWIDDLGAQDHLIRVGVLTLNLMPFLMTVINILSGMVYAKDFPRKEKRQLYGIALVFLVFLYRSPAGLVFYWTMNNVFSLIKNIYKKYVKLPSVFPEKDMAVSSKQQIEINPHKKQVDVKKEKRKLRNRKVPGSGKWLPKRIFVLSGILITLVAGALISSGVIAVSPAEYINVYQYQNPLESVWDNTVTAAGLFLLWGSVLFYLATEQKKQRYSLIYWICAVIFIANYMLFGKNLGTITVDYVFDIAPSFSFIEIMLNICLLFAVFYVSYFLWKKKKKVVIRLCSVLIIAIILFTGINCIQINGDIKELRIKSKEVQDEISSYSPVIHLSKKGKNVVVFMLDRAIGGYLPALLEEKPELGEDFSGFVYYPNTLSYGLCTNYGSPALFGGYEYTPLEMNRRDSELLADKHNEALKVMPVLFWQNGFDVSVCDPPYAGYEWIPDLSIYDEYDGIRTSNLEGRYTSLAHGEIVDYLQNKRERNALFYSLFRMSPVFLQTVIYDDGNYFSMDSNHSINTGFYDWVSSLEHLSELTEISDDDVNTFYMSNNKTAHDVMMLQRPEYQPALFLRDTQRDAIYGTVGDGIRLVFHENNETEQAHYDCNMAAYVELAKWLEFLKSNDLYDNTRVIIVADHGYRLGQYENMQIWDDNEIECLNPVLLVKDFDSSGNLIIDNRFMTNADVPALAVKNLIKNPRNPFSGKKISSDAKKDDQYVTTNWEWDIEKNSGTTFDTEGDGHWYSVHDDIFNLSNWTQLEEEPGN